MNTLRDFVPPCGTQLRCGVGALCWWRACRTAPATNEKARESLWLGSIDNRQLSIVWCPEQGTHLIEHPLILVVRRPLLQNAVHKPISPPIPSTLIDNPLSRGYIAASSHVPDLY